MSRIRIIRSREELLKMQRLRQNRYYEKNKKRFKEEAMNGKWKKNCPVCNKEVVYTNQSNLIKSIREQLSCKSCGQKLRPYEYLFNSIRYKSNIRNIPFSLKYEEFVEFTKKITCQYCEDVIEWNKYASNNSKNKYCYNLDRINNNEGYTKLNCCVCCKTCNGIKSDIFSYDEMIELGKVVKTIKNKRHE